MKPFHTPSIEMQAPDDWNDASTYTIYGPSVADGRPTMVVTMTRSVPVGGARTHVDQQLPELEKLPEFQRERLDVIQGKEQVFLQFAWKQPGGPHLRVRQWYLIINKVLYTLTATAPAAVFAEKEALFDQMVRSFKPKNW
jgi:hypothetical protein